MYPYITVFGKSIPMYGVMIFLGTAAALIYIKVNERRRAFPSADVDLALIYSLIGMAVGAKLIYLLSAWPSLFAELQQAGNDPWPVWLKYLQGGFVFYGGLYGALAAGWIYCKCNKLQFYDFCQLMLPAGVLFHIFGRLGCFCMGCCYGCPSTVFGIAFTHSDVAPNNIPLVPVQLIEAVGELLIFLVLARMARQENSGRKILVIYLVTYAVMRFILEFFRGDEVRGFLGPLSTSQALAILSVVIGGVLMLPAKKANPPTTK